MGFSLGDVQLVAKHRGRIRLVQQVLAGRRIRCSSFIRTIPPGCECWCLFFRGLHDADHLSVVSGTHLSSSSSPSPSSPPSSSFTSPPKSYALSQSSRITCSIVHPRRGGGYCGLVGCLAASQESEIHRMTIHEFQHMLVITLLSPHHSAQRNDLQKCLSSR